MDRDRDRYQLQPLLYPALPLTHSLNPTSPAAITLAVRCAEGNGGNLYVGSSDGVVHHYILRNEGSSQNPNQFELVSSKVISSSGKPIERLLILHRIGVAAVLAESTLSFLHLPNLDPLPPNTLPIVRNVVTMVLDDSEVQEGGIDGQGHVSLCIVKRRQVILAKIGMGRYVVTKDLPVPPGIVLVRRYGDLLCAASTTDYSLITLSTGAVMPLGLPISHSRDSPSASTRPCMVSVSEKSGATSATEFLITSHSDDQTLGVFITLSGEPAAKLIEFPSHPRALCVEWPHLVALLRNDTIQVYSLQSMQNVQTVQLPDLLEPRLLSSGQSSLHTGTGRRLEGKIWTNVGLSACNHDDEKREENPAAFLDFTETVKHPAWRKEITGGAIHQSSILMTCRNAVQALCESIPLSKAVSLLANESWGSLEILADKEWQEDSGEDSSRRMPPSLPHIYALLTMRYLSLLNFHAAATAFRRSSLDYRIILRLFPNLWEVTEADHADIFSPLKTLVDDWRPLENMLAASLEQNYSPAWRDEPSLQELHSQLRTRAYDMMEEVLESVRNSKLPLVDNTLARLYAMRDKREKFSTLLLSDNVCDLNVVESRAEALGATAALAELHFRHQNLSQAIELWIWLIDSDLPDVDMTRGVQDVIEVLEESGQPELQSRYALWVVKYDVQAGVKLLTRSSGEVQLSSAVRADEDHGIIIAKLREAGAQEAADQYTEQIVFSHPSTSGLERDLIDTLLSRVESAIQDEKKREVLRELTQDYIRGGYAEGFAGHLAIQTNTLPDIIDRLKLIMLLQGSQKYDASSLLSRIEKLSTGEASILAYERAILLGRLSRHEEALKLLALVLCDANSSEAYCSQGGIVLSPFMAEQIASSAGEGTLVQYAALVSRGVKARRVKGIVKDRLLMSLLKVYMESKSGSSFRTATAHLLNTQALRLTTLEILPLVPDDWPVSTLGTFLKRNLRRQSHKRHEGTIKRAVALSQSLEATEETWKKMRAMGGLIQEEEEDEEGSGDNDSPRAGAVAEDVGREEDSIIEKVVGDEMEKAANAAVPTGRDQVVEIMLDKEGARVDSMQAHERQRMY